MKNTLLAEQRYDAVWRVALPYLRARKNDIHIPLSYGFAVRLCQQHPEASPDIVLPGIILHDIGWALIDERQIFEQGFGPNMMESDVRRRHELEGARLARELLLELKYPVSTIDEIARIIDGHDTRRAALSLNDELVKDADKLWRFTITGIAVACDWFQLTPAQYAARLEREIVDALFRPWSCEVARETLAASRVALRCDVLP
ncbi:MAG: HD domain-containing protein [Ktedonobacteraceae bacterium]|nr:HD domain-containing protein [Ktedonobacteraceae bacterium]